VERRTHQAGIRNIMALLIILFGLLGTSVPLLEVVPRLKLTLDVVNSRILGGILCLEVMSSWPLNTNTATQVSRWDQTSSYTPTPGYFGRERTPSVFCPSPTYTYGDPSPPSQRPASDRLGFLEGTGPNRRGARDGDPESVKYLTEWKVTLNNRFLAKVTEQDLVYRPSIYRQRIKEKAERIVQRKKFSQPTSAVR
jgi:hypothetical protein